MVWIIRSVFWVSSQFCQAFEKVALKFFPSYMKGKCTENLFRMGPDGSLRPSTSHSALSSHSFPAMVMYSSPLPTLQHSWVCQPLLSQTCPSSFRAPFISVLLSRWIDPCTRCRRTRVPALVRAGFLDQFFSYFSSFVDQIHGFFKIRLAVWFIRKVNWHITINDEQFFRNCKFNIRIGVKNCGKKFGSWSWSWKNDL